MLWARESGTMGWRRRDSSCDVGGMSDDRVYSVFRYGKVNAMPVTFWRDEKDPVSDDAPLSR